MSVYNRFENKDGLLVALAMRALAQLAEAIVVPGDVGPVERFRQACHGYRKVVAGRDVVLTLVELVEALRSDAHQSDSTEAVQTAWNAMHGAVTIEHAGIGHTPMRT
ncbi:hypothetical protein [Mycolicibacterium hodleri]